MAATAVERMRLFAAAFSSRHDDLDEMWLVGSYAAGTATPDSDIDVVLIVRPGGQLTRVPRSCDWGSDEEGNVRWLQHEAAAQLGFPPSPPAHLCLITIDPAEPASAETRATPAPGTVVLYARDSSPSLRWREQEQAATRLAHA